MNKDQVCGRAIEEINKLVIKLHIDYSSDEDFVKYFQNVKKKYQPLEPSKVKKPKLGDRVILRLSRAEKQAQYRNKKKKTQLLKQASQEYRKLLKEKYHTVSYYNYELVG